MNNPEVVFSQNIQKLIDEAKALRPDSPITFTQMTDEELLRESAGAALVEDNIGNETIHVDHSRIDEYKIAHEIMHTILHRSGWPRMYCIVPTNIDPLARQIADSIDNSLDHFIFNPRLEAFGFEAKPYKEWYVSAIEEWPSTKLTGPSILECAFKILDGLLLGGEPRKRIIEALESKQPEPLALARQLAHKASSAKAQTKSGVRSAMVAMLDFLEEWTSSQSGSVQNLRWRIGISPLFTKAQLRRPASLIIELDSSQVSVNSTQLWVSGLILKLDGTRFRNYIAEGATTEPPEIDLVRQHLMTQTVKEFIKSEGIRKTGTFL